MFNHDIFLVSTSLLPRGCWFSQLRQRQCGRICVDDIQLWVVAACKLPSPSQVVIILANIWPFIIEHIVRSSGWSVTGCLLKSPMLCSWEQHNPRGYMGIYCRRSRQKKTVPSSVSWDGRDFSQRAGSEWSWSDELDAVSLSTRSKDV